MSLIGKELIVMQGEDTGKIYKIISDPFPEEGTDRILIHALNNEEKVLIDVSDIIERRMYDIIYPGNSVLRECKKEMLYMVATTPSVSPKKILEKLKEKGFSTKVISIATKELLC